MLDNQELGKCQKIMEQETSNKLQGLSYECGSYYEINFIYYISLTL